MIISDTHRYVYIGIPRTGKTPGAGMCQKLFVDLAGVTLVLFFERLPGCLRELPFVDPDTMPAFPHHPERGIRPPYKPSGGIAAQPGSMESRWAYGSRWPGGSTPNRHTRQRTQLRWKEVAHHRLPEH
jgi:hypothetical protein